MTEKLMSMAGSTADLPVRSFAEAKFSGRSRLYVGNLGSEITEQDLKDCFSSYGEIAEVFLNKEKGFAFVRLVSSGKNKIKIGYFIYFLVRITNLVLNERSGNLMGRY